MSCRYIHDWTFGSPAFVVLERTLIIALNLSSRPQSHALLFTTTMITPACPEFHGHIGCYSVSSSTQREGGHQSHWFTMPVHRRASVSTFREKIPRVPTPVYKAEGGAVGEDGSGLRY